MADQHPAQSAKKSKGFLKHLKRIFRPKSQSNPPSHLPSRESNQSNMPLTNATIAAPSAVAVLPASPSPLADLTPTASTIPMNPEEAEKLRAMYTHFRILVIGRANAGKTTLLKRVCNTKKDPVYDKVRYQLRFIPSYPSYTYRLTRPRGYYLCTFLCSGC